MIALLLSISSTASAVELAPAVHGPEGVWFAAAGVDQQPDFQGEPMGDLAPWEWLAPEDVLLAWGAFSEGEVLHGGVLWLEVQPSTGAPRLMVVSELQDESALVDFGPGELIAWVQPESESVQGWPPQALDLVVAVWEDLPDGPVEGTGEVVYAASTGGSALIVLLPGCFPSDPEGVTEDNGDPNLEEEEEESEDVEDEDGNADESPVE